MPSIAPQTGDMPFSKEEQRLLAEFGQGQRASEIGEHLSANPHLPSTDLYDAWLAGWCEGEGPVYTVADRARVDYRRSTLADIWPATGLPNLAGR